MVLVCIHVFVGDPFKFHYWLAQCGVYLAVMLIEKVIVGPLVFFDFWKKVGLIVWVGVCIREALLLLSCCSSSELGRFSGTPGTG
jgi:hypothetical protein